MFWSIDSEKKKHGITLWFLLKSNSLKQSPKFVGQYTWKWTLYCHKLDGIHRQMPSYIKKTILNCYVYSYALCWYSLENSKSFQRNWHIIFEFMLVFLENSCQNFLTTHESCCHDTKRVKVVKSCYSLVAEQCSEYSECSEIEFWHLSPTYAVAGWCHWRPPHVSWINH